MQYPRGLGMRQQRRLACMLEESPWEIVLMKFAHSLPLPHSFCCLVDYHPDWRVSDLILFSSQRETRRPSVLVFLTGIHPTLEASCGKKGAMSSQFLSSWKKKKKRVLKIQSPTCTSLLYPSQEHCLHPTTKHTAGNSAVSMVIMNSNRQ